MSNLQFQGSELNLIEINGQTWLQASDIAKALGYTRSDKVTQVYDRHKEEFSDSMTRIFVNLSLGHGTVPTEVRLFSLRGAHLLGMFARTKNGKNFRKWVLNQLEKIELQALPQRSLMFEWFEAKADLDSQVKFASMCGKGLNDHKKQKPPLLDRVIQLTDRLQPSLFKHLTA